MADPASNSPTVVISRIQNRRGTQDQFDALYPVGYTGVGGTTGLGILYPGEIALCTDSRRVFIGTLNGEYIEFGSGATTVTGGGGGNSGVISDLSIVLPPVSTFVDLPQLDFSPTALNNISYYVVDSAAGASTKVGNRYTKNGELKITALPTTVELSDVGVELNETISDLSFKARYDATMGKVRISYRHNFPGNLTFSTFSVVWVSI